MSMPDDPNVANVANAVAQVKNRAIAPNTLEYMRTRMHAIDTSTPSGSIAGIDSSDNILLQVPDLPGAGVAGYSFSLVVTDPSGRLQMVRQRAAEHYDDPYHYEDLLIEILYELPTQEERRLQSVSDYQWRTLMSAPTGQIPYLEEHPLWKLRLAAARARDLTEKRAMRIFLNQDNVRVNILLKDGRLSSQNCSTRYTDNLARLFVRRGVRWVGVVKQGSLLWTVIHPYHKKLSEAWNGRPYWTQLAPELIWEAYATDQSQPKTLLLGARESQSLGGVGGLWVLYSPSPRAYFVLEFNVYDMEVFHSLIDSGEPLERAHRSGGRGLPVHIVRPESGGGYEGTLLSATNRDFEQLVAPAVAEIHHYATLSQATPNYPVALADAHNKCKITQERKERKNRDLIQEFVRRGYHLVDFEQFNEDPHKTFEQ